MSNGILPAGDGFRKNSLITKAADATLYDDMDLLHLSAPGAA